MPVTAQRKVAHVSDSKRLDKLSQVAFLVMCAAVAAAAVNHLVLARTTPERTPLPPPVAAGTRLELPAAVTDGGKTGAVLLLLSAECRYCTESMPMYRQLARQREIASGNVRLAVVSMEPLAEMRDYLDTHNLRPTHLMTLVESGLRIGATPALVLVDREGIVAASWVGALPSSEEKKVFTAVTALLEKEETNE